MEGVEEVEDVEDEAPAAAGLCLARKLASLGMADSRYYTPRRIQSEDHFALGQFSVSALDDGAASATGAPDLLVGYSPRPVLINFHPSPRRFSTSVLGIAVMPQATLWALHAARIV